MASTGIADVIVPKGGFASSSENDRAASELYSGPKSKKVPIHDGCIPRLSDNIIDTAKRRGYLTAEFN